MSKTTVRPGALSIAYEQAFPGEPLPPDMRTLRSKVDAAMRGPARSEALAGLDRILERGNPTELERLLGTINASLSGRQRAAAHARPRASDVTTRQFAQNLTPLELARSHIADAALAHHAAEEITWFQLDALKALYELPTIRPRRHTALCGPFSTAEQLVPQYVAALRAAGMLPDGDLIRTIRQGDTLANIRDTTRAAAEHGESVLLVDAKALVSGSPNCSAAQACREVFTLMLDSGPTRVIIAGDELAAVWDRDWLAEGIKRRVPFVVRLGQTAP